MISTKMRLVRRNLIGHGFWMFLCGLLGGLGFTAFLLGGIEVYPGKIVPLSLPGTEAGWRGCHTGPISNGVMVILTALSIPKLGIPDGIAEWLCWIIKMDGWANVGFYFFANLSPNRGQALGGSRIGPSNVFSALALVPAALFGFPAIAAFAVAGYYAVSNQLFPESQYGKAKTR